MTFLKHILVPDPLYPEMTMSVIQQRSSVRSVGPDTMGMQSSCHGPSTDCPSKRFLRYNILRWQSSCAVVTLGLPVLGLRSDQSVKNADEGS